MLHDTDYHIAWTHRTPRGCRDVLERPRIHHGPYLGARDLRQGDALEGDRYLDELVSRNPVEAWRIVSEYIKPPMDTRGFVITRWLRGDTGFNGRNPGPMRHIPREEVWSWIEADPEARASYVANMAPKEFTVEAWKDS